MCYVSIRFLIHLLKKEKSLIFRNYKDLSHRKRWRINKLPLLFQFISLFHRCFIYGGYDEEKEMIKMKLIRKVMMLGVVCLSIALVGCQNKTEALTSSVTIKDKASFKPMNETIDYKEDYVYEYLGLKFSLSQNIKEAMNNKSLVMLDSQSALNEKLRYAFLSFNKVSRKQQDAVVQNMNEYMEWEKNLERSGTIGMYKKGMSEKEITELTQCTYHKKIGISHDGQYSYYISYQNDAFKRELEQCHIEIIDRLEENDNGFVLKEKNDLENTEVFND